jgi:hypothetical protein
LRARISLRNPLTVSWSYEVVNDVERYRPYVHAGGSAGRPVMRT